MAHRTRPRYQAPVQASSSEQRLAAARRKDAAANATMLGTVDRGGDRRRGLWQQRGVLDELVELHHPEPER
ncbi:MAG: hypothetical protein E6J14_11110 [Chloroflexi bacterium]|nr:MAG: hypothetical protein E6J14_11110 [Chloroflexota bacterium]